VSKYAIDPIPLKRGLNLKFNKIGKVTGLRGRLKELKVVGFISYSKSSERNFEISWLMVNLGDQHGLFRIGVLKSPDVLIS
jgi:hypothetical protein